MKQMKMKSLLWKMGLQKKPQKTHTNNIMPSKFPPRVQKVSNSSSTMYIVLQQRDHNLHVTLCATASQISQLHMLAKTIQLQKNMRCSHESNRSETKAVRNNSVVFSRCCHREIHQWLHMPLSLIDLGHSGVFVFLFCFYQEVQCFCWAVDLNKMCVWITVMHFMQFICWEYECSLIYSFVSDFFGLSVLFAIIRGKPSG